MRTGITGALVVPGENDNGRMVEYVLRGGCVWVTRTLSKRVCIITQGRQEATLSEGKEYDRSGSVKEGYVALCGGCEGSDSIKTKPLRSPCCNV